MIEWAASAALHHRLHCRTGCRAAKGGAAAAGEHCYIENVPGLHRIMLFRQSQVRAGGRGHIVRLAVRSQNQDPSWGAREQLWKARASGAQMGDCQSGVQVQSARECDVPAARASAGEQLAPKSPAGTVGCGSLRVSNGNSNSNSNRAAAPRCDGCWQRKCGHARPPRHDALTCRRARLRCAERRFDSLRRRQRAVSGHAH